MDKSGDDRSFQIPSTTQRSGTYHGMDQLRILDVNGGPDFSLNESVSFVIECEGSGEGRPAVGWADRGRRRARPMRLAQGPLRPFVADRAQGAKTR